METSMQIFTPKVPSIAEPTLAFKWWKGAYQRFDENGKLIPSDVEWLGRHGQRSLFWTKDEENTLKYKAKYRLAGLLLLWEDRKGA